MFFFPVGLSSFLRHPRQVLLGVEISSVAWLGRLTVGVQSVTEETSTPNKTCRGCRVNDERPTGKKNTTIEWDDGGKIGNKNKLLLSLPSSVVQWHHEEGNFLSEYGQSHWLFYVRYYLEESS